MSIAAPQPKHAKPHDGYATKQDAEDAQQKIDNYLALARRVTSVLMTVGGIALIFTMINVTLFATAHHTPWQIAWLLDPMVSLGLIAVLYFDGRLMELGNYKPSGWVLTMRYFTFAATWAMNVWGALYPDGSFTGMPANPDHAGILLHSTPPLLVFIMAEASTKYRVYVTGQVAHWQRNIDSYREGVRAQLAADEQTEKDRKNADEQTAQEKADREAKREEAQIEANRVAAEEAEKRKTKELENQLQADEDARKRKEETDRIAAEANRVAAEEAEKRKTKELENRLQAQEDERQREVKREEARIERERIATEEAEKRKTKEFENQLRANEDARKREEADRKRKEEADRIAAEGAEKDRKREERRAARRAAAEPPKETGEKPQEDAEHDKTGRVVQMSREERRAHQEAAVEDAAKLIIQHGGKDQLPMTTAEFGQRHGKGSTWGRERITEADARLVSDKEFYDRMETAALEELVKVS